MLYKNRYFLGLAASILLFFGPDLLVHLLRIPGLKYPDDCDIAARCEHTIVQIANFLGFGLFLLAPVLKLLGGFVLLVTGLFWGLRGFSKKAKGRPRSKLAQKITGTACVGVSLFFLYVPSGPDQCSRTVTDTQYEVCLESIFADMTILEVRHWFEENGFRVGTIIDTYSSSSSANDRRHAENPEFNYNFHFEAFRDFGSYSSVPYGTNFNRFFARIGPAPDRFELQLYGDTEDDAVVAVNVWWAFSFL